jgi:hypothetical protein
VPVRGSEQSRLSRARPHDYSRTTTTVNLPTARARLTYRCACHANWSKYPSVEHLPPPSSGSHGATFGPPGFEPRTAHPGSSPARPTRVRAPPWIFDRARFSTDHSQRRGAVRGGDEPADRQVSHDRQPSRRGAVLGCIPPSRSPCASITFAQLNSGIKLPLRPRFRTCTGHQPAPPSTRLVRIEDRECAGRLRPRRAHSTRVDLAASTARPPAALA